MYHVLMFPISISLYKMLCWAPNIYIIIWLTRFISPFLASTSGHFDHKQEVRLTSFLHHLPFNPRPPNFFPIDFLWAASDLHWTVAPQMPRLPNTRSAFHFWRGSVNPLSWKRSTQSTKASGVITISFLSLKWIKTVLVWCLRQHLKLLSNCCCGGQISHNYHKMKKNQQARGLINAALMLDKLFCTVWPTSLNYGWTVEEQLMKFCSLF